MENITENSLTNTIDGPHILDKYNVETTITEIKAQIEKMNFENDKFKDNVEKQLARLNTNLEKVITIIESKNSNKRPSGRANRSPPISADVLELNVSGVTEGFTLRRQLLCQVPGSALEAMFSERNDVMLQRVNNKVFVDRDPKIFKYVVMYLRNNQKLPMIQDKFRRELFEQELDFWGLKQDYSVLKSMIELFESQPDEIHEVVLRKWKDLGPLDLLGLISQKKIKFDEKVEITQEIGILNCANKKYNYFGQINESGHIQGVGRRCDYGQSMYEGESKDSLQDGYGRAIYVNGGYYEGEHKHGQRNGRGKYVHKNGVIEQGIWEQDVFQK